LTGLSIARQADLAEVGALATGDRASHLRKAGWDVGCTPHPATHKPGVRISITIYIRFTNNQSLEGALPW
jgi:hypothetical protein